MLSTERLHELASMLDLSEKIALLTGRDFWTTVPIERIGLRSIVMSDGPAGIRGEAWDERDPSLNLPSGTALASSWDREAATEYGRASAREALRKGVHVVLGPTINLHRSPLGGRHFEAYSEDPLLTGELAAAYIRGVQELGAAATPKHYVANDSETERFTVDVRVDARALRELYLRPFEDAVRDGGAWAIMSAYNSINGATATENDLLDSPLNDEWGFDGVVISDWTAVRSIESARHAQDIAMPGPDSIWNRDLEAAVRDGAVDEAAIDRKVIRILRLADRVGALGAPTPSSSDPGVDGIAVARASAIGGSVLLRNEGLLPLDPATSAIAVSGHNASVARTQGGGSATVVPARIVSPLDGIREAFPDAAVSYSIGAIVENGLTELPVELLANPVTGGRGSRLSFLAEDGTVLHTEDRFATRLVWFGGVAPIGSTARLVVETVYTPDQTGVQRIGFAAVGTVRFEVDGEIVVERTLEATAQDLGAALLAPPHVAVPLDLRAGVPVKLRLEYEPERFADGLSNAMGFTFGREPDDSDSAVLIAAAAAAAAEAEVAVVVIGTNADVESEGHDRRSLALPGDQDDLVRAVAAANPRTVVVVNAGAPVLMPWRDEVAAILVGFFGGQEIGHAIGDILSGAREPGGRLTTTWPVAESDPPVLDVTPVDGHLDYTEGIHIGYRAWLRAGRTPAYPFGHGLGYTEWSFDGVEVPAGPLTPDGEVVLSVTLTNTGARAGRTVVQVYAERTDSAIERPVRWLVGFAPADAAAGAVVVVPVRLRARDLAHWTADGWAYEPGAFTVSVGASVTDLRLSATVELAGA